MAYVIAIGGTRGVAKSTLARKFAEVLRADNLSVGRARDLLRPLVDRKENQEFFRSVTSSKSKRAAIETLKAQARLLREPIQAVIDKCVRRNASLIIEGSHILPGFLDKVDTTVFLHAPEAVVVRRLRKDKERPISNNNVKRVLQIQKWLVEEAGVNPAMLVDSVSIPAAFVLISRLLSTDKLPVTEFPVGLEK